MGQICYAGRAISSMCERLVFLVRLSNCKFSLMQIAVIHQPEGTRNQSNASPISSMADAGFKHPFRNYSPILYPDSQTFSNSALLDTTGIYVGRLN